MRRRHRTSRRKGQLTLRRLDRDYPHQVEAIIPDMGLGTRLNRLHDWVTDRGFDYQVWPADHYPVQAMRWCFRRADDAAAFQAHLAAIEASRES